MFVSGERIWSWASCVANVCSLALAIMSGVNLWPERNKILVRAPYSSGMITCLLWESLEWDKPPPTLPAQGLTFLRRFLLLVSSMPTSINVLQTLPVASHCGSRRQVCSRYRRLERSHPRPSWVKCARRRLYIDGMCSTPYTNSCRQMLLGAQYCGQSLQVVTLFSRAD